MDFPAGHDNPNLTLPLGTEVELVVEEATGWIVYREDALLPAGISSPPTASVTDPPTASISISS